MLALGRYFGAAKQLPGVKELFEKEAPRKVRTPWPFCPLSGRHLMTEFQTAACLSCAWPGKGKGKGEKEKERKKEKNHRAQVGLWPAEGLRQERCAVT